MTGLILFTRAVLLVLLVCVGAMANGDEIEWARFNLYDGPAGLGHISREMTVRVTQSPLSGSGPVLGIALWHGECYMNIKLGPGLAIDTASDDPPTTFTDGSIGHRIYPVPGGLEWELILAERPNSNKFVFDIETEGMTFYRQDSLSDFEKRPLGAFRPDSVVGAWVAYHSSKANNRLVIRANDTTYHEYRTGQAFIIYRPKAWHGNDTVWCDLAIDEREGRLTISVDSAWLDAAEYPVTIDPTFGNTDIGASTLSWNQSFAYCHCLTGTNTYIVPQNKAASIAGYSVYGCETGAGDLTVNMAAFNVDDGIPADRVDQLSSVSVSGGTPGWFSSSAVAHVLEPLVEYGVAVGCAPRSGGTIYYNTVSDATATDNTNCTLNSTEWTPATMTGLNLSMYATYTEEDIGTTVRFRRRKGLQSAFSKWRDR